MPLVLDPNVPHIALVDQLLDLLHELIPGQLDLLAPPMSFLSTRAHGRSPFSA